jgi:hypothetical protein
MPILTRTEDGVGQWTIDYTVDGKWTPAREDEPAGSPEFALDSVELDGTEFPLDYLADWVRDMFVEWCVEDSQE